MTAKRLKVVLIGAGSAIFGPVSIYDMLTTTLKEGGEMALVDVNDVSARRMESLAEKMCAFLGLEVSVSSSQDRREVLKDADVVIISAEVERIERWRQDWDIPRKFGIEHTLGENRGPAGLSHTLRTVPLVLEMCRDIEELAPKAFVLVMTNPEDRIAYAMHRYTGLNGYGYCDGLWDFKHHYIGQALGIPGEEIIVEAAGINHSVWITRLTRRGTSENLYPKMVELGVAGKFEPFGYHLYRRYGLWPHENDEHYGEYFHYASKFIECKGYDFDGHLNEEAVWKDKIDGAVSGRDTMDGFMEEMGRRNWDIFGDSPPSDAVRGVKQGIPTAIPNVNVPNRGRIPGLPDDMIIEVPGIALPGEVQGLGGYILPEPILAMLYREGVIQKLAAEAAVEGDRKKALLCLEMDPQVPDPFTAEKLLDAFLDAHGDLIPCDILKGLKEI